MFEIASHYKLVENKYYLPDVSVVEYFVKDARLARWLKNDVNKIINNNNYKDSSVIKGRITVNYTNYKVNRNIPDRIFRNNLDD